MRALLDELGHRRLPEDDREPRPARLRAARAAVGLLRRSARAAVAVARELERRQPDLITAAWWKEERGERVFVDFNQNAPHKTVFGAWSVRRPRRRAGVDARSPGTRSTTIHPDELTIADRAGRGSPPHGDPWADMDDDPQSIEPLLAMYEQDRANGLMDAPWPPVYPKLPDEPPRVAPAAPARSDGHTSMAFVSRDRDLLRAKDLADARYFEPLGVDDLARAAGFSRAHFSREFRRTFGESPHSYLLTRRLERAAALLRNTDRSVAHLRRRRAAERRLVHHELHPHLRRLPNRVPRLVPASGQLRDIPTCLFARTDARETARFEKTGAPQVLSVRGTRSVDEEDE